MMAKMKGQRGASTDVVGVSHGEALHKAIIETIELNGPIEAHVQRELQEADNRLISCNTIKIYEKESYI